MHSHSTRFSKFYLLDDDSRVGIICNFRSTNQENFVSRLLFRVDGSIVFTPRFCFHNLMYYRQNNNGTSLFFFCFFVFDITWRSGRFDLWYSTGFVNHLLYYRFNLFFIFSSSLFLLVIFFFNSYFCIVTRSSALCADLSNVELIFSIWWLFAICRLHGEVILCKRVNV